MTTRHMDFDAARSDSETTDDPLTFTLGGDTWTVRSDISGALLMDFILSERVTDQLRAGKDLLVNGIVPDEQERFKEMLRTGKPGGVLLRADLAAKDVKELKALAKAQDPSIKGYTKLKHDDLVNALAGKPDGMAIPAPSMQQIDEVIAWLVRELIGRPTTQE